MFQAAVGKDIEKQQAAEASSIHRIRIVLTACNVRSLEKVCADLIQGAKKQKLRVKVRNSLMNSTGHLPGGLLRLYKLDCPSYVNAKLPSESSVS